MKRFINIYSDTEVDGRIISNQDYDNAQECYDNRDKLSTYLETVEIISVEVAE